MKKHLLFLLLIVNSCFAYSFENVSIPSANSQYSANTTENSVISDEEFNILEKKIFNKTYSNDSAKNRLARLEKEIFGMEQKGSQEERFDNLITASDYYQSGYRQSKSIAEEKSKTKNNTEEYKINPKDYINDYNFGYESENEISPKYTMNQSPSSYENNYYKEPQKIKKQSAIKQFFSDIVDALTAGVVTGYTLPMDSFDYDPLGTYTNIGGSNFTVVPQFSTYTYIPQVNSYISPYRYNRQRYPYITRNNYYYNPPPPRYNYNRTPYGNGVRNYKSGAGVRIIH